MADATATYKFFKEIRPITVSEAEFVEAAKRFFRAQFKEVGGVGAAVERRGWVAEDGRSPFFVLCDALAQQVVEKHEFKPFKLTLNGSGEGPELAPLDIYQGAYYGLLVEFNACTIRVLNYTDSTKVEVSYDWPEDWSEVDEVHGTGSGGSHRSKDYAFDLNDPESVPQITERVLDLCEMMLTQQAPPIVI